MSSGYLRNKYRCLLKPNVNVFYLDNNIQNPENPKPRIYPYGYTGAYPGYPIYPYVEKSKDKDPKHIKEYKDNKPKMTSNCYYHYDSSSSDDSCRYRRRSGP